MRLTFDGVSDNRQCLNVTIIDDSDFERDVNFFFCSAARKCRSN